MNSVKTPSVEVVYDFCKASNFSDLSWDDAMFFLGKHLLDTKMINVIYFEKGKTNYVFL